MDFFKKFPLVDFDIKKDGTVQKMVDVFRSVRPVEEFLDDPAAYRLYEIRNGERPDIVSTRLYGSPEFYWTFFVINEFLHDGYRAWPLPEEDLLEYILTEYDGYAITTQPTFIEDQADSIAGKFALGEVITGNRSGAQGTLVKKNVDMNQLIVQNVTLGTAGIHPVTGSDSNVVGGAFIGDVSAGDNNPTEPIAGGTSGDVVASYRVFKYADAPYYYYNILDPDKKPVSNAAFLGDVAGTVSEGSLAFETYRTHEIELNEERSRIRYISPEFINQFVDKFETLIND